VGVVEVVVAGPSAPQPDNETVATSANMAKNTPVTFCLIDFIINIFPFSRHAQFSEPAHYNKSTLNTIA
jgi:hypothetical protein